MANSSTITYYWKNTELAAGLAGDLLRMGRGRTPLLDKIGGLGANAMQAKDWRFILNNQYNLEAPSQSSITEANAVTAPPTPMTYDKAQDYNVCQPFHKGVTVSYQAQSATAYLSGLPLAGAEQEPTDPLVFQLRANMEQLALDIDWHFINGTYNAAANATQAYQTRGLLEATTTTKIDAGGDALTTDDIDTAMLSLADTAKAPMRDMWVLCSAKLKQKLTQLYGVAPFAPPTNTMGGQNIDTIITDFGPLKLMYEPQMPDNTKLLIVDMPDIAPVFLPVPGKGAVFYEPTAKTGTADPGQLYAQVGLGYVAEEHHGQIYNLVA